MNWYIYGGLILTTVVLFLLNLFLPPVEGQIKDESQSNN